jgi:glycoprotein-N-acetylgalactosamine 3-beta-galactosyltransferase
MWAYVFHNYLDDYDWVHIAGDDVYVAVDNLRAYVDSPEMAALEEGHNDAIFRVQNRGGKANTDHLRPRPLLLGIPMPFRQVFFPAGGPGYTLNRAAVKFFGEKSLTNFLPAARDSREDVFMGSAFHGEGVFLADTRDAVNGTRYGSSAETSTYFSGGPHFIGPERQKRLFGIEYALFEDNASSQQIGFHLKDDKKMLTALNRTISDSIYRYHTFLYNLTDDLCG